MTDIEMWFEIAKMIRDDNPVGPFICILANQLLRRDEITKRQRLRVDAAVDQERVHQYRAANNQVLWRGVFDHRRESALRIRFCAEQIRRLTWEARA